MMNDVSMTTPDIPNRLTRVQIFHYQVMTYFSISFTRYKSNVLVDKNQKRRDAIIRESIARFNTKHQQSIQSRRCSIALATTIFNEVYDRIGDGGYLSVPYFMKYHYFTT